MMSMKASFFSRAAVGIAVMLSVFTLAGCGIQVRKTQAELDAEKVAKEKAGAENGDPFDQANYGLYLVQQKDYAAAHSWFMKSAQSGNRWGQELVAKDYFTGNGVDKDYALSASWMKKAADQGDADAQYFLGQMYGQGWGVPKDKARQIALIEQAAQQRNAKALQALVELGDPHGIAREVIAQQAAEQRALAAQYRNEESQRANQQPSYQPQQQMCQMNNGVTTYWAPC
jgi:TPR repeat protein